MGSPQIGFTLIRDILTRWNFDIPNQFSALLTKTPAYLPALPLPTGEASQTFYRLLS
jgi:hypothetical protein